MIAFQHTGGFIWKEKYILFFFLNRNPISWAWIRFLWSGTGILDFQSCFFSTRTGILVLASFGLPLSLEVGVCTIWKHSWLQNKHIQHIHTDPLMSTTAVNANADQEIFSIPNRDQIFNSPIQLLITGTGIVKSHSGFLSTKTGFPEFWFLIQFRSSPKLTLNYSISPQ